MSHPWTDSPSHPSPDALIHILAGARQPEDLGVPLVALYRGTVYARLEHGAGLLDLELAIERGQITGIVEICAPSCYRVYVNGRCRYETRSMAVAAAELSEQIERPGLLQRIGQWFLDKHDARTTDILVNALADAREMPV